MLVRVCTVRLGRGHRAGAGWLKALAVGLGLFATFGAVPVSVSGGIASQSLEPQNSHPLSSPNFPPRVHFGLTSNNSSLNRSEEFSSCSTYVGIYYCFPEQAYWSNCFPDGLYCYDTWHLSVDVVVAQAPTGLGASSSVSLWSGLENEQCWGLISGNCVLLQPILEYYDGGILAFAGICIGSNGGGDCDTQWSYDTGFYPSEGNTLEFDIWDTSAGADCLNAEVFDLTTGQSSGGLNDNCQNNWGWHMPIATFAMEDHNIDPECPSSDYPYEPSSDLPLPVKSSDPGDWFYFSDASLNPNIVGESDYIDGNCLAWEATYEEPQDWEAFNMPS